MRDRDACIGWTACRRGVVLVCALLLGLAAPALGTRQTAGGPSTPLSDPPIGMHSMLYLDTPVGAMKAMFQQATELGASEIRVNIELSDVFPGVPRRRGGSVVSRVAHQPGVIRSDLWSRQQVGEEALTHPHWDAVNEYIQLARAYHIHVEAVLTSTPSWLADCPRGTPSTQMYRCPPRDASQWGRAAGEIAQHTKGVIQDFEILNEPDGRWSFLGSPQQYASLLAASYDDIHAASPTARVLLGGLMRLDGTGFRWMDEMLSTPGTRAIHKFDVANIHVRLAPAEVTRTVCQWRSYFVQRGFQGPLWVTETGYPADRSEQTDPGYENGEAAQARWLTSVVPTLLADGVSNVFVTERDLSHGGFASEGVLQTPNPLPASPKARRRPSFYALQRLARGAWVSAELESSSQPNGTC